MIFGDVPPFPQSETPLQNVRTQHFEVGLYSEVRRGFSYEASHRQIGEALRAYYLNRVYEDSQEKVGTVALNSRRVNRLMKQVQSSRVQMQLTTARDPDTRDLLALNARWGLAAKDKLAKSKIRGLQNQPAPISREIYHPDRVLVPVNDLDQTVK